jgi:hypothetical protein
MQETHGIYSIPIVPEDSRGSLTRGTIECTWLSLEMSSLEECWILCKIGLPYSTNCLEIKRGSTGVNMRTDARIERCP